MDDILAISVSLVIICEYDDFYGILLALVDLDYFMDMVVLECKLVMNDVVVCYMALLVLFMDIRYCDSFYYPWNG